MNTQIMKVKTSTRVNMVYLYSRYIIENYGEAFWHQIISEYLNQYNSLDQCLSYEDPQFQELLKLTGKHTRKQNSTILAGFDYYLSVIQTVGV
ncbi:MAG: hypothetical protein ACW98K_03580 [Candidatus Kariarchaeaceae archaeon]|jgi:hypothetical protein